MTKRPSAITHQFSEPGARATGGETPRSRLGLGSVAGDCAREFTPSVAPTSSPRARTSGPNLSLWDYVSFTIVHAVGAWLLACLSLPGLYQFGRLFGTLEWLINYKRRRRFAAALERAVGRKPSAGERRRAAREYFMRSRCDKLFYLILDCIPRDKAITLLSIGDRALLDEAVARGRGVYVAMAHHGALHVVAMLMALRGYRIAGVRDRREGGLRRYVQDRLDRRYPEFQRMRVLFADSYPREVYRCLREGYLLGSAMDIGRLRNPSQRTEEVTIFGERRGFLSGPLRIAIRCRAPVLQAFVVPGKAFHYHLEIAGMLADPEQIEEEDAAVSQAMHIYAANVEKYVRASPSLLSRI